MSEKYKVGYKKPPKSGQFQPGQSGNKKGRPKGTNNLKTDLADELKELIPIKEDGKARKVSKQRAMLKALTAKGIRGDTKSAHVILNLVLKVLTADAPIETTEVTAEDKAIIENFKNSVLATSKKG